MIALYARVSTQEQAQHGCSISEQLERMEKYCEAMRWKKTKQYADPGFSGAKLERPALQRLIEDVKAGRIQRVVVYKLDRLSRSQKDTLCLIEDTFLAHGVEFVSICENFDTSTPFGRAMIGILAVFAQLEREQIKERMTMGREAMLKSGRYICRKPPFGYAWSDDHRLMVPKDDEAAVVRMIYQDFASGARYYAIYMKLREIGFPMSDTSVRDVLTRRAYIGEIEYSGKIYQGAHEPIIDRDLFDRVQSIVARNAVAFKEYNARPGHATSILGGLLVCGKCGYKYVRTKWNYKEPRYCCSTRTARHRDVRDAVCDGAHWIIGELDALVLGEIRKLALDPSAIDETETPDPGLERTLLEERVKKAEKQVERLIDLYSIGEISPELLNGKIEAANATLVSLRDKLSTMKVDARLPKTEAKRIVTDLGDVLDTGSFEEIRAVVTALIDKIVITDGDVDIYWSFA